MNIRPDRDALLDAVALLQARHRGDEEGYNVILAAADDPQLLDALYYLRGLVVQDWFVADLRRRLREQD
jgi:hypothetical protein